MPVFKPIVWIIFGLVVAALEMVVPGMVIIWFGIAAVVTGLLAFFVHNPTVHFVVFLVLSGLMVFFSQWIGRKITKPEPVPVGARRFDGAVGAVTQDVRPGTTGRVKVLGEEWRAESGSVLPAGARVRVVRVEGTRLIVEAQEEGR